MIVRRGVMHALENVHLISPEAGRVDAEGDDLGTQISVLPRLA